MIPGRPKVLRVDVARFPDEETSVRVTQGYYLPFSLKLSPMLVTNIAIIVIALIKELDPDGVVVNPAGLGAVVTDILRSEGFERKLYRWIEPGLGERDAS